MKGRNDRRRESYRHMDLKGLKEAAKTLTPILRIGKSGLTDGVISEIDLQLKKNHLIKIKLLGSFRENNDRRDISSTISERTRSKIILQVGGVIVLFRK